MFPLLAEFQDIAFLMLRLMVGSVFAASGWSHLRDPEGRSKSIGMSRGFTIFLGAAEMAGALGVVFGVVWLSGSFEVCSVSAAASLVTALSGWGFVLTAS